MSLRAQVYASIVGIATLFGLLSFALTDSIIAAGVTAGAATTLSGMIIRSFVERGNESYGGEWLAGATASGCFASITGGLLQVFLLGLTLFFVRRLVVCNRKIRPAS